MQTQTEMWSNYFTKRQKGAICDLNMLNKYKVHYVRVVGLFNVCTFLQTYNNRGNDDDDDDDDNNNNNK
jgi:ribulose bisphosphate carboxylase small subunit